MKEEIMKKLNIDDLIYDLLVGEKRLIIFTEESKKSVYPYIIEYSKKEFYPRTYDNGKQVFLGFTDQLYYEAWVKSIKEESYIVVLTKQNEDYLGDYIVDLKNEVAVSIDAILYFPQYCKTYLHYLTNNITSLHNKCKKLENITNDLVRDKFLRGEAIDVGSNNSDLKSTNNIYDSIEYSELSSIGGKSPYFEEDEI